ncbi:MAG: hypothetical protein QHH06_05075 [Clostridiales bacterium]|jgi:hypothetical protein|nr:hypothetical protein [Eubacteriales bacterium]MDH7565840.1 hypothetical protein [Clostridiales bacterium]
MFRNLFISLVILSTLTAEGVAGFSASYFNVYLYLNKGLCLLHEKTEFSGKVREAENTGAGFGKGFKACKYTLAPGDTQELKYNIIDIDVANAEKDAYYVCLSAGIYCCPLLGADKDTVLEKSDTSPPCINA